MAAMPPSDPRPASSPRPADVWTVTRLNREARRLLEGGLPELWLEGEISNLARPASGHIYFSLKDARCQLRCAMFRQRNSRLAFRPENGDAVLCRGRVSLYEPRGDFQFIVEHMEAAGEGALLREFERLKARLAEEGLFAAELKRPLPPLPHRIGVVTSPSGAAVRDVLNILRRRFPAVPVRIYPVPVQGEAAAPAIAGALATVGRRQDCDVVILARGGGSLEDLWAFNEEIVARAIRACPVPVVSGVGHEIDFTIADFAADVRAPTPSGAAELVVPDRQETLRMLTDRAGVLRRGIRRRLDDVVRRQQWLTHRLQQQHPGVRLQQQSQRLDELQLRLGRATRGMAERHAARLASLQSRLAARSPALAVRAREEHLRALHERLAHGLERRLSALSGRLEVAQRTLGAVSPVATLERGYAIATLAEGGLLTDAAQVGAGDGVDLRLARGRVRTEVKDSDDA